MAATVKHLKQFEKIFLGIRDNADEKLAQLKSEFLDHQEWLRKAVVDTKESKYGCLPAVPCVPCPCVLLARVSCGVLLTVVSPFGARAPLQGRARPRVSRDRAQGQGGKLAHSREGRGGQGECRQRRQAVAQQTQHEEQRQVGR